MKEEPLVRFVNKVKELSPEAYIDDPTSDKVLIKVDLFTEDVFD
jgi:hypothetical protein